MTVFALGGTIASTKSSQSEGGVTPQLGAAELIAAVPQLDEIAQLTAETFRQTPSGDLSFQDIVALAAAIEKAREDGASGTVVTQGTDTIEETSFALDLLLPPGRPVVVTGAMRNPTLAGADGPANLLSAVQVASSQAAAGLGVLVVLNDEIHTARFVRKTHTSSPATFRSITAGPIGWVTEGQVRVALAPTGPTPTLVVPQGKPPAVALLTMSLSCDSRLIDSLENLGYQGLVVEGFGGGHVPAQLVPALERLAARLPVVLASRTGSGETLQQTYGFPGSERDLLARGLIAAGFLDGLKARILLTFLLAEKRDVTTIRETFDNFNGRQPE
ncbi:MAG: asparaginase [Nakamurella sp.]